MDYDRDMDREIQSLLDSLDDICDSKDIFWYIVL